MDRYAHLYTEDQETLADRLDGMFRNAAHSDLDQAWTSPRS